MLELRTLTQNNLLTVERRMVKGQNQAWQWYLKNKESLQRHFANNKPENSNGVLQEKIELCLRHLASCPRQIIVPFWWKGPEKSTYCY